MQTSTFGAILGAVATLSLGVWIGMWARKPTIDTLIERNNNLAELDSVKTVQLSKLRDAFEITSFEFANARDFFATVTDSMGALIVELTDQIKDQDQQIEFLSSVNARLEYDLETALSNVAVSGDTVRAQIEDKQQFEDGHINTDGEVVIDTKQRTGSATLSYDIGLTPTVALSRDDAGVAKCTVSFGDMPITADDILCMNNIDPELPTRGEINLPQVGIGVGVGVLAILLLGIVF